jgi:hypothetical protein
MVLQPTFKISTRIHHTASYIGNRASHNQQAFAILTQNHLLSSFEELESGPIMDSFSQKTYHQVPDDDYSDKSPRDHELTSTLLKKRILYFVAFAALVALVVSIFYTKQATPKEHCGKSREEAISHGCSFDPISTTWLPASCSRKWTEEFLNVSGVGFYAADGSDAHEIDLSAQPINSTYLISRGQHVAHCLYLFLRMIDAPKGVPTTIASSSSHRDHCARMIIQESTFSPYYNVVGDAGRVKLGTCS